jgi:hypothetical protein
MLEEFLHLSSDPEKSSQERSHSVFPLIQWRDRELADLCDDLRCSTAL